jgi:hypothetical protein
MAITINTAAVTSITTDTGSSTTDFITNDQTLTFGGSITPISGNDSGTLGIWLSGGSFGTANGGKGTLIGSITISVTGAWSFTYSSSIPEGSYIIHITNGTSTTASDLASHSLTEDQTLPTALTITSVTDDVSPITQALSSGASTNDNNLRVRCSLTDTGAVAGDTIQLYNGSGTDSQLGTSYTITATDIRRGFANVQTGTLSDGTYTITARITDQAGNQSAVSLNSFVETVDTTAPSGGTPDLTAASDSGASSTDDLTSSTAPSFAVALDGTVAAGDTVDCCWRVPLWPPRWFTQSAPPTCWRAASA